MKTLVGFWGYLEGNSLNINRGDTLIRMFEYQAVLKATEINSVNATAIFTNCCCLVYLTPCSWLLQIEAHRTNQNVGDAISSLILGCKGSPNTAVFGLPLHPRIYLQDSGDEQT
jgi:hypothetical protein